MNETTRCTDCRSEFTESQITGVNACPVCGTDSVPMNIADDVTIAINWHELRILGIWASNWAEKFCEAKSRRTLGNILRSITAQHPGRGALTMAGELQEVADHFGTDITVTGGDTTRTIKGVKPS
jgi:hypothetical protein